MPKPRILRGFLLHNGVTPVTFSSTTFRVQSVLTQYLWRDKLRTNIPMRSVIYSADPDFVANFQLASSAFNIQQEHVANPTDLVHRCTTQTYDLIVVDIDAPTNGHEMIPIIRRESANREVVVFAAGNEQPPDAMVSLGASLALRKPISLDLARRHLRDALLITDGERRLFNRVPVAGPLHMRSTSDGKIEGELVNIGEGGLAMKLARVPKERAIVEVFFKLPGENTEFHAPGKITWADPTGYVGVRFGAMEPTSRYRLSDWIANAEKIREQTQA